MGFKVFADGDVLTAAQVNDYLMEQAVIACTSGTRPSSPNEGMVIYETDTDRVLIYDGSAWIRTGWSTSAGRTGCALRRAANQSISTGTSYTNITWDTEDADTDGFISVSSTTVTIPSGLGGLYLVRFTVDAGLPTNGSAGKVRIVAGGVTHSQGYGAYDAGGGLAITVPLAAADTITCGMAQNVGGSANATARLWVYRIGA